tara:strand:- start:27 stop:164 length:138 start_codon:yes stop_codon:yes gene_type:complete
MALVLAWEVKTPSTHSITTANKMARHGMRRIALRRANRNNDSISS